MNISDLEIVIENLRGSYKKFADSLDEYPILGVTFATHYGFIKGYTGEDEHELDVFLGKGKKCGYITFLRSNVKGGMETKMFLNISEDELGQTIKEYGPVVKEVVEFLNHEEFLGFIGSFKDAE